MSFFGTACNFWKAGCCGCLRKVKENDNPKSTIEPNSAQLNDSDELPSNDRIEKTKMATKTIKKEKEDSPPRQKRQIKVWTEEEDNLLRTYYAKFGANNWNEIAKHIPGRNGSQCSQRWRRKYKPEKIRKNWTAEEDNLLLELVKLYGQNWQLISNHMKGSINRTGKQVRERFLNKLDPKISRNPFTEEEDRIILEEYKRIGKKWSEISKSLNGRPENAVKNRFYSHIKRKILGGNIENNTLEQDLNNDFEDSNNENIDNDENENEDSELAEMENLTIEERPETENQTTEADKNNEDLPQTQVIHLDSVKKLVSKKLVTNGTFENTLPEQNYPPTNQENNRLYDPPNNNSNSGSVNNNSGSVKIGHSGSAKMDIEYDMMKQFDSQNSKKAYIEERKISYDNMENFKLNVLPNFESSGGAYPSLNKGFSTETDKLLRSNNTFEKMESYNSNDQDANPILKFKENFVSEGQNNLKQEEFPVENYLEKHERR